jgi:PTH1 family peptidyl-tRNA hydrolase
VGLGNPGPAYANTRHNVGFMILDRLRAELPGGSETFLHAADSQLWHCRFRTRHIWLQQPQTFMNLSGRAVGKWARRQGIAPEHILLVYDELDLPLGRLRFRRQGGSAGHRGVESVIAELGSSNFLRLRIGIGKSTGETIDHVLSTFDEAEASLVDSVLEHSVAAIRLLLSRGLGGAMTQYNGMTISISEPCEDTQRGNIDQI